MIKTKINKVVLGAILAVDSSQITRISYVENYIVIGIDDNSKVATIIPYSNENKRTDAYIPIKWGDAEVPSYLDILGLVSVGVPVLDNASILMGVVSDDIVSEIRKAISDFYNPANTTTYATEYAADTAEDIEGNDNVDGMKLNFNLDLNKVYTKMNKTKDSRKYRPYNYPELIPSDIRLVEPGDRMDSAEDYIQYFSHYNSLGKNVFLKEYCITGAAVAHRINTFNQKYSSLGYYATRNHKKNGKIYITIPEDNNLEPKSIVDLSELSDPIDINCSIRLL